MHEKKFFTLFLFILATVLIVGSGAVSVRADTTTDLQAQINAKLAQKAALDAENAALQAQINDTNSQANTLSNTLKKLDTTQKKIQSDTKITQNNISTTELGIQKTGIEIETTEQKIAGNKKALEESVRKLNENGDVTFVEALLQYKDVTELWSAVETLHEFETNLKKETDDLIDAQNDLHQKQNDYVAKKQNLTVQQSSLIAQQTIIAQNKAAKAKLLADTKDKEANYQKQLAANIEKGKQFDQDLFDFESKLNVHIDTSSLPAIGSSPLSWPLAKIVVTQKFGKTVDAKRLYVSGTHNGVDFGTPVGSKVMAAADGVVTGMGNTDEEAGCYSYGRWLLIKYNNGLSSLYAHLSAYMPTTVMGAAVTRGQIVAFSGGLPGAFGSGYSIGPHLHMGLFASNGVEVVKYTSSNYCKNVSIPIVQGLSAYLDPLAYLPALP